MVIKKIKNANAPRLPDGTYAPRTKRVPQTCAGCGKTFLRFISQLKGGLTYCSMRCRRKWQPHPCPQCGVVVTKKRQYCSKTCYDAYQSRNKIERVCVECCVKFLVSPSRIVHDPTLYCSEKCYRGSISMHEMLIANNLKMQNSKKQTKLEREGEEILKSLGILYAAQVLVGQKIVVDAIVPSHSLIIQWDGDYWHGYGCHDWRMHPEKRVQKRMYNDMSQDAYLKACGYTVLRFWEHEVNKESDQVRAKIKSILCAIRKKEAA